MDKIVASIVKELINSENSRKNVGFSERILLTPGRSISRFLLPGGYAEARLQI